MDPNTEDENFFSDTPPGLVCSCLIEAKATLASRLKQHSLVLLLQSDPTFVPLRRPDSIAASSRSSGTESDDSSVKSVRFSKLAEVC